jgi:hypothetical protein
MTACPAKSRNFFLPFSDNFFFPQWLGVRALYGTSFSREPDRTLATIRHSASGVSSNMHQHTSKTNLTQWTPVLSMAMNGSRKVWSLLLNRYNVLIG